MIPTRIRKAAVVNLDQLAAMDLMIWLGTSERAAAVAGTNQSTISRRSRSALQIFDLRLQRSHHGAHLRGDLQLLQLERRVHQQVRLHGRRPLRLQVPFWTRRRALQDVPEGWCANPATCGAVCEDPISLLRHRVIDAALVTPTQLSQPSDDLLLVDLYRRPIELTLFPQDGDRDVIEMFRRHRRQGALALRRSPFLPLSCLHRSDQWLGALAAAAEVPLRQCALEAMPVAFLTPEMRDAQPRPWCVHSAVEPYPYVERLAVLAEHADAPAMQRLLDHLQQVFAPLAHAA